METWSAPAIATAVYACVELFKRVAEDGERYKRWYPLAAAVLGMGFGAIAYATGSPEISADSLMGAIFVGLCSGLCATGTDQLIRKTIHKNLSRTKSNEEGSKPADEGQICCLPAADEERGEADGRDPIRSDQSDCDRG